MLYSKDIFRKSVLEFLFSRICFDLSRFWPFQNWIEIVVFCLVWSLVCLHDDKLIKPKTDVTSPGCLQTPNKTTVDQSQTERNSREGEIFPLPYLFKNNSKDDLLTGQKLPRTPGLPSSNRLSCWQVIWQTDSQTGENSPTHKKTSFRAGVNENGKLPCRLLSYLIIHLVLDLVGHSANWFAHWGKFPNTYKKVSLCGGHWKWQTALQSTVILDRKLGSPSRWSFCKLIRTLGKIPPPIQKKVFWSRGNWKWKTALQTTLILERKIGSPSRWSFCKLIRTLGKIPQHI